PHGFTPLHGCAPQAPVIEHPAVVVYVGAHDHNACEVRGGFGLRSRVHADDYAPKYLHDLTGLAPVVINPVTLPHCTLSRCGPLLIHGRPGTCRRRGLDPLPVLLGATASALHELTELA